MQKPHIKITMQYQEILPMLKFYRKITKNNLDGNITIRIKTKETFSQKWFKNKHYSSQKITTVGF